MVGFVQAALHALLRMNHQVWSMVSGPDIVQFTAAPSMTAQTLQRQDSEHLQFVYPVLKMQARRERKDPERTIW
jgi:hypothetical protein